MIQSVLRRDGMQALDYGEPAGYPPLRETIARILASQGIPAHPEQILITSGSQQAIALVTHLLLKPGDTVLVESPTYALALDLFRALRLKVVGVPIDEHGMQVEALEPLLQQHRPCLIYTIPNFHNPDRRLPQPGAPPRADRAGRPLQLAHPGRRLRRRPAL